jgi:hypothetical protein
MANTVIALKKSATPSSVPSNLANGELAINYADGKLYYKAANGTIASISGNEPNYFGTVNANNTLVVADTPGDIFTIAAGKNIDIVGDAINDKLTVRLTDDVAVSGLLSVTASSGDEGGEIRLANAVTNSLLAGPVNIDIYQNQLRFFVSGGDARGAFINLAATSAGVGTDLLATSSGADAYARTTANQAFDKANAALPNVSGAWFNGTLTASQNLAADKIISTNNGNGENFKVGDDTWIGDTNLANALRIKGQQNASIGYIIFGPNDGKLLGRAGTDNLTYDGNTIWHAGNDGIGSGLDADLLDGQNGTYYGKADDLIAAYTHANNAFNRANTANITADRAFNHANAAFITANIAFANSNTVMISAQAAFTVANSGFLHANASYAFANVIAITANLAFAHANAAFANGNTVIQTAQSAFNQANLAFIHANNAFASANAGQASGNAGQATANASYVFANSAHSIANLAFTHANNAYAKANTANITADLAFAHANAAFFSSNSLNTYTNSTYVKLSASSQTITGDLDIVGTLTLSGNTVFIDATRLQIDDPLIYLAGNNYTSDIVDIGFIANYVNATGQNVHTGLYREHENKEYYLFQGYDKEPANNHIGALSNNMTLAVLNADIKTSNLILGGVNAIATIGASFNHANAAHASANAGQATANASYAFANSAHSIANLAFTQANTARIHANVSFEQANTARVHANAAFASANAGQATANASYAFGNSAHSIANLAFTHANNAYDQANNALANVTTRATYSGNLDFTAGGISFGSRVSSASTNVMNHIALWGTSFGFSITNQNLNAVVPATANVTILVGSTQRARVNSTGMWVEGGVNASSMIKSAGLYDSSDRQLLIKDSTGTVVWGN